MPSSPSWLKALKAIGKKPPRPEDLDRLRDEMIAEQNDRGAALIASALVESVLKSLILTRLVPMGDAELDGLFGRDAPLSSFSHKIRIAHAFGIIDDKIRRDLDRLREIRNAFSHGLGSVLN